MNINSVTFNEQEVFSWRNNIAYNMAQQESIMQS